MPINSFLYPGAKVTIAYEVANSLRFDDGSSDYLSKTFSSYDSTKKFTISVWLKKSANGVHNSIYGKDGASSSASQFYFDSSSEQLRFYDSTSGSAMDLLTNRLFRDNSAWYNIILAVDTTQGTASNRVKIYVNGTQETSFATETYPAQDSTLKALDSSKDTFIGVGENTSGTKFGYFNGYMAEYVFIDGSRLTPSSFGEFDEDSPTIWKPKNVSGLTFGTNGFYLDFENSSALGNDISGNDNDFTANNLAAIDQSTDTCTNNFATMNPLDNYIQGATFSEGNLQVVTGQSGYWAPSLSTIGLTKGKWYCEIELDTTGGSGAAVGVTAKQITADAVMGDDANAHAYLLYDGQSRTGGTSSSFGDTLANGDVVGIALDLDNNKVYFSKNGTFQASGDPAGNSNGLAITAPASTDTGFYHIGVQDVGNGTPGTTYKVNFGSPMYSISSGNADGNGHGNFEYAVPSGFFALCTKNLAEFG